MFRLAHISDTHVLSADGVHWRELFFNKRITGMEAIVVDAAGGSLRRTDVPTLAECL